MLHQSGKVNRDPRSAYPGPLCADNTHPPPSRSTVEGMVKPADKSVVKIPARIAVTALATTVALYASGWFGLVVWVIVTTPFRGWSGDHVLAWVQSICSFGGAALACWFTWRRTGGGQKSRRGVLAMTLRWAFIAGGIGFALGFFGPIVFMPGANQGPMLGIFITGPLGFLGGALGGFVRAISRPAAQPSAA